MLLKLQINFSEQHNALRDSPDLIIGTGFAPRALTTSSYATMSAAARFAATMVEAIDPLALPAVGRGLLFRIRRDSTLVDIQSGRPVGRLALRSKTGKVLTSLETSVRKIADPTPKRQTNMVAKPPRRKISDRV